MKKTIAPFLFYLLIIVLTPIFVFAISASDKEAQLQAQLDQLEKEKVAIQQNLNSTKAETASIQRDINIVTAQINQAKLNIKEKTINIEVLGKDISAKTARVSELNTQIQTGQESLGQIIRKLNQMDSYTLPEIVLSKNSLSDILVDIDTFNSVNRSLEDLFAQIRGVKTETEKEKEALDAKQSAELDAKQALEANKRKVEQKDAEQKQLLLISKTKEVTYAQVIANKEKQAQQIRDALFSLRDSSGIQFGQALDYAKNVSKATGVRPAFLLAILTQESNLGKNVGSCLMTDLTTGSGKGKNTGTVFEKVMKVPRDTEPFKSITSILNRDWTNTPVSCPIGGTSYYVGRGYGGAMGPAQFIPSTWMLFESRIEKALGISQADPWRAQDAFMASGFYLGDLGAGQGDYSSEIKAACKYYGSGGSNCTYGNQVMAKAANIQETMIDVLENN